MGVLGAKVGQDVSGVERGVRNPTVVVLEKLAEPLGIQVWQLLVPEE